MSKVRHLKVIKTGFVHVSEYKDVKDWLFGPPRFGCRLVTDEELQAFKEKCKVVGIRREE